MQAYLAAAAASFALLVAAGSVKAETYTAFQRHDEVEHTDTNFAGAEYSWFALPLFDTSLGRLLGVRLSGRFAYQLTAAWLPGPVDNGYIHYAQFEFREAFLGTLPCCAPEGGPILLGDGPIAFAIPQGAPPGSYVGPIYRSPRVSFVFRDPVLIASLLGDPEQSPPQAYAGVDFLQQEGECNSDHERCTQMDMRSVFTRDLQVDYIYKATGSVPEPATWALLLSGFLSVGTLLRKSRRRPGSTGLVGGDQ